MSTIRTNAIVDAAGGNTTTVNGTLIPASGVTLVSTNETQTLTNKTLTSPTITGASITGSTVSGGTIATGTVWTYSTPVSSVDFPGIPSGVQRVTVMFGGVSTNGTSPPLLQIGSGSVTTTGYLGANTTTSSGAATANFTTGFGIGTSVNQWTAAAVAHGAISITLISGNTWACSGIVGLSSGPQLFYTAGSVTLTGTLDRIRVTTLGGTDTFDAGSINIMWEG